MFTRAASRGAVRLYIVLLIISAIGAFIYSFITFPRMPHVHGGLAFVYPIHEQSRVVQFYRENRCLPTRVLIGAAPLQEKPCPTDEANAELLAIISDIAKNIVDVDIGYPVRADDHSITRRGNLSGVVFSSERDDHGALAYHTVEYLRENPP